MDPSDTRQAFVLHFELIEQARLRELHRWLTYEGLSGGLMGLSYVVPYGIIFMLLKGAALLFSPYMLLRLFQGGRYGWIVGFTITVGLPFLLVLLVQPEGVAGILFSAFPLVTFYAFTWLLRYSVGEWIEEAELAIRHADV